MGKMDFKKIGFPKVRHQYDDMRCMHGRYVWVRGHAHSGCVGMHTEQASEGQDDAGLYQCTQLIKHHACSSCVCIYEHVLAHVFNRSMTSHCCAAFWTLKGLPKVLS